MKKTRIILSMMMIVTFLPLVVRGELAEPLFEEFQANGPLGMKLDITLHRVKITRFLGARVELSARVEVRPGEAAVLEELRFSGMRIDGKTPVYLEPLEGQYALRRDMPLELPPVCCIARRRRSPWQTKRWLRLAFGLMWKKGV